MPKLPNISILPSEVVELLEAVGYVEAVNLCKADVEELLDELIKANKRLGIMSSEPTAKALKSWQRMLTDIRNDTRTDGNETGENSGAGESVETFDAVSPLVNFEEDTEVKEMLAIAPEAIQLDPSLIRSYKVAICDIPEGLLLTRCEGEVEVNVMTAEQLTKIELREAKIKHPDRIIPPVRSFSQTQSAGQHIKPLEKGKSRDVDTQSNGLNSGVSFCSKRFVRGVMHPDPLNVEKSAYFTLLVQLLFVINFIGIPWLLIYEYLSRKNMICWVVGISAGLVLSALCYLFWGRNARCRICGQNQFLPKKCLKNKKAHHIPFIGYIFPTALHAIFYKWFYCIYCGTAVRLKK